MGVTIIEFQFDPQMKWMEVGDDFINLQEKTSRKEFRVEDSGVMCVRESPAGYNDIIFIQDAVFMELMKMFIRKKGLTIKDLFEI